MTRFDDKLLCCRPVLISRLCVQIPQLVHSTQDTSGEGEYGLAPEAQHIALNLQQRWSRDAATLPNAALIACILFTSGEAAEWRIARAQGERKAPVHTGTVQQHQPQVDMRRQQTAAGQRVALAPVGRAGELSLIHI